MSEHHLPAQRVRTLPIIAAALVAVGASLTLLSWLLSSLVLKSGSRGLVSMNPATALLFLAAAGALALLSKEPRKPSIERLAAALAYPITIVGLVLLTRYLTPWDPAIDRMLFRDQLGDNRMAQNTALHFVLIGLSLLTLDARWSYVRGLSQVMALAVAVGSAMSLIGYGYSARHLYGIGPYIPMALNTAALFAIFSVGLLLARLERGALAVLASRNVGGIMARRLLPAAIIIPVLLGFLCLVGQRADLYDSEFGTSLMVVATGVLLGAATLVAAGTVSRTDAVRIEVEERAAGQTRILRSILDSMGDGVVVCDANGKFLIFNPAAEEILGLGQTDTLPSEWASRYGLYLADTTTPCPVEQVPLARTLRGESTDAVELLARHPGRPQGVWISVTGRPVYNQAGGISGGVVVFRNITDLKATQQALLQSEERLRLLVESVIDYAIIMLDPDGNVLSWNIGAERLKGYQAHEIVGRHFSCFYPDDAIERGWPARELEIARAEGRIEDESWRLRKDGSRFWANVVITAIRDKTGQLQGFSKVTRDLTERMRAVEALHQLNEDLERRVESRTAELAAANRDLLQKNQENEMFVYSVSHDLRSPLVSLQGFSKELGFVTQELKTLLANNSVPEEIRAQASAYLDTDMPQSLKFIQSGVVRLSNIIDALLRLSRVGRVEYDFRTLDVNGIVSRVVEAMSGELFAKCVDVRVKELPPCHGDATAVEQLFANLIGNAVKYLDEDRKGQIEVGAASVADSEDSNVRTYYVRDNGLGIPVAYQEKIFQAFQRVHPKHASGEGMGLAIVRRIVQRHGGLIRVESKEGCGSTFFITLPSSIAAGAVPAANDASQEKGNSHAERTNGHLAGGRR